MDEFRFVLKFSENTRPVKPEAGSGHSTKSSKASGKRSSRSIDSLVCDKSNLREQKV